MEADDIAELGLEGFDKLASKDFYGLPHKVAHAHPMEATRHPLDKARAHHDRKHHPHRRNASTGGDGRYNANGPYDPQYADSQYQDPYPGRGQQDRQQGGGYEDWSDEDRCERRRRREANARPRGPPRRTSSVGPPVRGPYANAGMGDYQAPASRGGYLYDLDDGDRERGYPSTRPRSGSRSQRRRDSRYEDGRYDSDEGSRDNRRDKRDRKDRRGKEEEEKDWKGNVREGMNASAWGAIAGGLVGSEVGKKSPIIATFVGAGLGGLAGKALEKKDRERRARRWDS